MRPQQNRRISSSRRSNNSGLRRPSNPLARNYESSGPDVKIRGNAQHIADKYLALARDAQASGDRVMGENYLQHAEHYLRIILAAQPGEKEMRSAGRADHETAEAEEAEPDTAEDWNGSPQPVIDGLPGEVALMDKRGGYNKAGHADAYGEEEKYGRPQQPRRRLPARRSNQAARRPGRPYGDEVSAAPADKSADRAETDRPAAAHRHGNIAAAAALPGAIQPSQLRKLRRPRAIEEGETEQPDI